MELIDLGRFVISLMFVLGLILFIAFLAKKFGLERRLNRLSKQERLEITARINIDAKNKVVIVRRDDKEHLLLVGPNGNLIIEKIDD